MAHGCRRGPLGGNVRVGLEDNFYLPDGEMAKSNGDLVECAALSVQLSGRAAASPAEARALLGLPEDPDRSTLAGWKEDLGERGGSG